MFSRKQFSQIKERFKCDSLLPIDGTGKNRVKSFQVI